MSTNVNPKVVDRWLEAMQSGRITPNGAEVWERKLALTLAVLLATGGTPQAVGRARRLLASLQAAMEQHYHV